MITTFRTFAAYVVAPVVVATTFVAVANNYEALNNRARQVVPDTCIQDEAALANCKFGSVF